MFSKLTSNQNHTRLQFIRGLSLFGLVLSVGSGFAGVGDRIEVKDTRVVAIRPELHGKVTPETLFEMLHKRNVKNYGASSVTSKGPNEATMAVTGDKTPAYVANGYIKVGDVESNLKITVVKKANEVIQKVNATFTSFPYGLAKDGDGTIKFQVSDDAIVIDFAGGGTQVSDNRLVKDAPKAVAKQVLAGVEKDLTTAYGLK